jgi:hypothetical protein
MTLSTTILRFAAAAALAALCATALPAPSAPSSAVVSVAEGADFFVVRGAAVLTGGRGVTLLPGDLIQTGAGGLLILELRGESATDVIVAIGPATEAYWMDRHPAAALAVLRGWIKVDSLSSAHGMEFKTVGRRLGGSSGAGVYVLHVGETGDELFGESGQLTAWLMDSDGEGRAVPGKQNDFLSRDAAGSLQTHTGPGAAFVKALPAAFHDPLPVGMSSKISATPTLARVRDVQYDDVADWLAAPRTWRRGFIERFRGRLKDPTFFRALDAGLGAHPEWRRVLHPPQASESR